MPATPRLDERSLTEAYARHRALHEAADWVGLAELFADDASYLDSVYGWSHGRDTIRTFLEDSMRGLEGWSFPIHAVAVDAEHATVLNHWTNRLPGSRPDGSSYDVPGASVITYDADALITRQMDLFDTGRMMRVIDEWSADHDGALPYPSPG